jgi:hypothetical protein
LQVDLVKNGAFVHSCTNLCELWHKCFCHLHHGVLPLLKNLVQGLLYFNIEKEGVAGHVSLASMQRKHFLATSIDREGFLI